MKKKIILFMLTAAVLALGACADVSLTYRLGDDNTVRINYDADMSRADEDVSVFLDEIGAYWTAQGLDVTADKGVGTLHGQATHGYDSAALAAQEFGRLVTLEDGFFYDVLFEYAPSFDVDTYRLSASISLADVIRQRKAQGISAERVAAVLKSAAEGAYSVSVALPGETVATNADSVEDGVYTWVLPYGEERRLSLETRRVNTENLELYAALQNKVAKNQTLLIVCLAVGGVSLPAIVATVLVRRARRRRASKIRVKQFR